MADVNKKATRESYGEALTALAEKYPELVVLDADLAAATKTGIFKKAYPDRFFDCGIAEANMMGVAAGLALAGNTWRARWKYRVFSDMNWLQALWIQAKGVVFEKNPKI